MGRDCQSYKQVGFLEGSFGFVLINRDLAVGFSRLPLFLYCHPGFKTHQAQ
jgi:hypothetical protein